MSQLMGDVVVLTLYGPCSSQTVIDLETKCREAILQKAKHILIDCENLTFLNPTALRCLLSQTSAAEKAGSCLALYKLNEEHTRQIRSAGLIGVLHIQKSFVDAYQHCKKQGSST